MSDCTQFPAWKKLKEHKKDMARIQMRFLFAEDPKRFKRFSLEAVGILLDFSKNRITGTTLKLLIHLARDSDLPTAIEAMFSGERINRTEGRAVLHTALRNRSAKPVYVDSVDVMPQVNEVLDRMRVFTEAVRSGKWRGYSGKRITDIVNIGIGGSDLGPVMVTQALTPYWQAGLHAHFVSNVDPSQIMETLAKVNPETTLFIVASKTFTTPETLLNAQVARRWLVDKLGDEAAVARHFVAISTNTRKVQEFGIDAVNMFEFWDWVGGRYSIWSAVGLSVALMVGMDHFETMLTGGFAMDEHFRSAPLEKNMPVIMALLGVWHNDFWNADSHAIFPYDQYLARFPAYLQQLDMESNGKSVTFSGKAVHCQTGPIIWGEPGCNGQHAFFQLVHQGTRLVPADFLVAAESQHPVEHQHEVLLANCFAQSKALMRGKTRDEARVELIRAGITGARLDTLLPHKVFPGNRPSNTLLYRKLDPYTLGALIALYEHKVFVQGVLWDINSFDQWGVELGKQLAGAIESGLIDEDKVTEHDSSTNGLMNACKRLRQS
ncbi:MAG: glucose-6-phosphate isomerase [Sulfuriferula sp.]|nr:glucose-6-phosphate isomerase [Sulfuriferula sp.]